MEAVEAFTRDPCEKQAMEYEALKIVGQIAGIGGISLGVVMLLFREFIRKNIFPNLTKEQAYRLIRLFLILTFLLGLAGIGAWVYSIRVSAPEHPPSTEDHKPPPHSDSSLPPEIDHAPETGRVEPTTPSEESLPLIASANDARLFVLSVGIAEYAHADLVSVPSTSNHANHFAEVLRQQEGAAYHQVIVRPLVNENASRVEILDALDWFCDQAGAGDLVMLLFSCQTLIMSERDIPELFFLPYDATPQKPRETAISYKEIEERIAEFRARVLLLFDGSNYRVPPVEPSIGVRQIFDGSSAPANLAVITPCIGTNGRSFFPRDERGIFTAAVLSGLRGEADLGKDGKVTLADLDEFIQQRLRGVSDLSVFTMKDESAWKSDVILEVPERAREDAG